VNLYKPGCWYAFLQCKVGLGCRFGPGTLKKVKQRGPGWLMRTYFSIFVVNKGRQKEQKSGNQEPHQVPALVSLKNQLLANYGATKKTCLFFPILEENNFNSHLVHQFP
jgi:hypothetical protein